MLKATTYGVGTTFITLGDVGTGRGGVAQLDVQASGATFTLTPRGRGRRSSRTLDATAPAVLTKNQGTGVAVANNQIAADGLYTVAADGLHLGLDLVVTAGAVILSADAVPAA